MTGFDNRRHWRHAADRAAGSQQPLESPIADPAADRPRGSCADAGISAARAAANAERPANLPAGAVDAPYTRAQGACFPALLVGRVSSDEAIAAITGFDMLARALQQHGLQTKMHGYPMFVLPQPGGLSHNTPYVTVVLGHHPDHRGRLWWWRILAGAIGPEGQSDQALLFAIGPIDEIAPVADHIARVLRQQTQSERYGEAPTPRPAHDWGLT